MLPKILNIFGNLKITIKIKHEKNKTFCINKLNSIFKALKFCVCITVITTNLNPNLNYFNVKKNIYKLSVKNNYSNADKIYLESYYYILF